MPAARFYSSTSGAMDLSASITSADTSIAVSSTTGLPGTTPFTLVLDPGTASEEIVDVVNVSGTTLTVVRGVDGSSAQAHSAGVKNVRHMATARDFREPQEHIGATSGVHGVVGSLVGTDGTQTLKNKTAQASSATAVALTVKATAGQTANVLEVQDTGSVARFTVDKDGVANSVPAAATTGIKVTQSGSPTAPGVHILSDKFLGSDDYIKLQPGQANVIDYVQGDYLLTTPASVKVGKSGRITVTGSAGSGEPTTPLLTLVNSDTNTPTTLSIKNSAGTEVAKVDKDGRLTTAQVTSTGDVAGTTGTFSGALSSPTITTLQNNDTTMSGQIGGIDTRVQALETSGWTNATLAGGVTGTLKYRQRGQSVDVSIDVAGSFPAGFSALSIAGALPAAVRPTTTPARAVAYVGSGTSMGSIEVTSAGTVNVQVPAGTAGVAKVQFTYPAN